MSFIKKLVDLVLYGNFWIATCALAMSWQSQCIFNQPLRLDIFSGLVFFATLFLYAAHRIVGISKSHEYFQLERYSVITTFKSHIQFYAVLGFVGSVVCFLYVNQAVQLALLIPGIISLGYVLPLLGNKKRLRDLNHIKIFLVAIVWAWVSVLLPALQYEQVIGSTIFIMTIERALFIFAITLPFDIRDLNVDQDSKVKTLPAQLGLVKTQYLGIFSLFICFLLTTLLWQQQFYSSTTLVVLIVSYFTTGLLVFASTPQRHDYFYTGLMDGTMIFQFLLVYFFSS